MKMINIPRNSGKTIAILKMSQEKNVAVYVKDKKRAEEIRSLCRELGLKEPTILIADEMKASREEFLEGEDHNK